MTGTDRHSEENYLKNTINIVNSNLQIYRSEVNRMQAEIDEMLEHYHDADVELWTLLNNTITLHDHMKRALQRNEKAICKPYFGRIIFHDKNLDRDESLYIGKGGISNDRTTQIVVDWRAPVANAYYENGLGDCSYSAPNGASIPIHLDLKRTYEIENGKLLDYVDTEVVSNDDLLMKYLSKNKEAVLGEIVATIQREQNEIIRKSPYHNCIVQGVAGSGKTTVAMHRISYILYNYQSRFKPDDFYIVGSNRILLNYITGVLPDLDVYGVRQMTMEQLMIRLLYEDWDDKAYQLRYQPDNEDKIKGTEEWFYDLLSFIREYENHTIPTEDIFLNPRQFVEGLVDGKSGVYDKREEDKRNHITPVLIPLIQKETTQRYIQSNPGISVQSKINMLNDRLETKIKDVFLNSSFIKYTEPERKAILRAYRSYYGPLTCKTSIYELYSSFLKSQAESGKHVRIPVDSLDVYDLAALALLYKLVKETEVISEAHHIVIDEAQDFGMMIYQVLNACIKDCTYTIMGDTSQNIHFGFGLSDWNALRKLLNKDPDSSFNTLRKSYRNTIEISEFATNILRHGSFPIYPTEPIIRHGKPVNIIRNEHNDLASFANLTADICTSWQKNGYETIAVICRDEQESIQLAKELSNYISILECDPEKANFANGIMVLPVDLTKGLEFDTVLLYQPTKESYPKDDGHAKLLYVACTRALHELTILTNGNITGLIVDPIEDSRKEEFHEEESISPRITPAKTVIPGKSEGLTKRTLVQARSREAAPSSSPSGNALKRLYSDKPVVNEKREEPKSNLTSAVNATSEILFGDMPDNSKLKPIGHSKINQSVRWSSKQNDDFYFQSQYGILRITPIGSAVFRITFSKGARLIDDQCHPAIKVNRMDPGCHFKDSLKTIELSTPEAKLIIDKASGAFQFQDASGHILLSEKKPESRQQEKDRNYWYLDLPKNEQLFALNAENGLFKLRGSARYLIADRKKRRLPFLFTDKGCGILPACSNPIIFCDIPAYGTYISEEAPQMDYYLIAGKQQKNLIEAYLYLCGL